VPIPVIIAKNVTGSPVTLTRLGVTILGNQSFTLSDFFRIEEIMAAPDLASAISGGSIVLNDGVGDLTQAQSTAYLTATNTPTGGGVTSPWKGPCRAATTANITLSGLQTVDGVSLAVGDRVLVKNQSTGSQNGLYAAASGAWSRAVDANETGELATGAVLVVTEGTTLGGTQWVLSTTGAIVIGTTALTFSQSGGTAPPAHASRHLPGGADALTTAAPVAIGDANAEGAAASFARSNHVHALGGAVGGQLSGTLPNPNVVGIRESAGPTNLTIGAIADGQTLIRSGSTIIGSAGGGGSFDMRDIIVYDHFMTGNVDLDEIGIMGWRTSISGASAAISTAAGVAGRPGIINVQTGTNAAGRASFYLGDGSSGARILLGGTNPLVMEFLVRFPAAADFSGTNLESVMLGLGLDWATNVELTNGLYFRYTPGTDSFWSLVAANASTRTVRASTVAPAAGSWVRLRVTATASSAQFNVNGVDVGTAITTNLPTTGVGVGVVTLGAGSANATFDVDYVLVTQVTNKET
jgi:hypothetical protein